MLLPKTWQDWVIAVGSFLFFVALLPSVFSENKPDVWTSGMTSLNLTAFTVIYYSLGLRFGTITTALATLAWYVLWYQKLF